MWNLVGLGAQVKTLLDRLTSTRAGYLDRLDATVSSRASASDWPASLASQINTNLDEAISGLPKLAIHTGYVHNGSTSNGSGEDQFYHNVNVAAHGITHYTKCIVLFQGIYGISGSSTYGIYQTARLTSNTNLRLAVTTTYSSWSAISGRYYIIEVL